MMWDFKAAFQSMGGYLKGLQSTVETDKPDKVTVDDS